MSPGKLGSRRHINLPGVHVNLPPLTKKDIVDLTLGVQLGVDFVGLSFARQKSDLDELRDFLAQKKSKALIVVMIEDQSTVRQIDEMIVDADAVMNECGDRGID